jgi:hypothetical protein
VPQGSCQVTYSCQCSTQLNVAEDPGNDWALPPSPAPEDPLAKLSKLDDLFEVECAVKPLGFLSIRLFNPESAPAPTPQAPARSNLLRTMEMEQAARLAHLERTKAEVATIIATVAAAQKAVEERALMEAAAAAEELTKEEECNAERGRRRKERSEGERGEKGDHDWEDNREKCLLKFVDAVVVKTMSKHPTQMDVDTFKKHAKEVQSFPFPHPPG